jgi:NADH dehydrogenase FAD-containing subunit
MEINISDRTRRSVETMAAEAGTAATSDVFAPAASEISRSLEDNFWAAFVEHATTASLAASPAAADGKKRKRVVIVGGGFCGAFAALKLDDDPRFETILVDTKEYFEYTPSILKAFCNPAAHESILQPHSEIVKNGRVIIGEVRAVREDCIAVNYETITFDYLIIATGSHYPSAIKSTNVSKAYRGKAVRHQHQLIEDAKDIVVIGGGVVGVEMAAEIATTFAGKGKTITLIHSRPRLLQRLAAPNPGCDPHEMAVSFLAKAGVTVRLEERATAWDDASKAVKTSAGDSIHADRVFWCGGPQPLTGFMRAHMSACLDEQGFIKANPDLSVEGYPNIFVGGDVATIKRRSSHAGESRSVSVSTGGSEPSVMDVEDIIRRTMADKGTDSASPSIMLHDDMYVKAEAGYSNEEKMAKNAMEHGLLIARNIRNLTDDKPTENRKVERGVHMMIVSLGATEGIFVNSGISAMGDFVAKKDWLEATIMQEIRERKMIIHA